MAQGDLNNRLPRESGTCCGITCCQWTVLLQAWPGSYQQRFTPLFLLLGLLSKERNAYSTAFPGSRHLPAADPSGNGLSPLPSHIPSWASPAQGVARAQKICSAWLTSKQNLPLDKQDHSSVGNLFVSGWSLSALFLSSYSADFIVSYHVFRMCGTVNPETMSPALFHFFSKANSQWNTTLRSTEFMVVSLGVLRRLYCATRKNRRFHLWAFSF